MRQPRRRPRAVSYSPATRHFRELFATHAEAERRKMPVDEVAGERRERLAAEQRRRSLEREQAEERRLTRRRLLAEATAAGVALTAAGVAARAARAASTSRIAIVGAGLAGIRCAHMLWTGGSRIASTVYEADTTHLGGRCWSLRGYFQNGLIGERGGAFINHDETAIRNLARNLGLREEVVNGGDLLTGEEIYWFDGNAYTYAEANDDWGEIGYPVFKNTYKLAPWPQRYNAFTAEGQRLDLVTVPDWLDQTGISSTSRFGRLMLANAVSEYGGDPGDQPALNLLYLLAWNSQNSLEPLPGYDEKYHVVGGNDQLVTRMVAQLPSGTIKQGYELVALKDNGDGTYTLTFQVGQRTSRVTVDQVVLALPFSTLRDVDLSHANLSPRKLQAIQQLGMGQSAKIHVQVRQKTWPPLGYSGVSYTDWDAFCVAWDDSVPLGTSGPAILVGYPGGSTGENVLTGAAHGPAPTRDVSWFLNQIEPIFPGTRAAYSGLAYEDHWSVDPWHRGAYSYWRLGQYTGFSGYEGVQEGNIHFAGEHTDPEEQGFLNGAVASGERAASEVMHQI
jgi:monoamine oxidase